MPEDAYSALSLSCCPSRAARDAGVQGASLQSDSGILASQDAQSAIRNPPNARQCCNPPQSAIRHS
eukprot:15462614-Alexandrium_andersonii.AAC.1